MTQVNLFEEKLPDIDVIKSRLKEAAKGKTVQDLKIMKAGKYVSKKKVGDKYDVTYSEDGKDGSKKEIGGHSLGKRQHNAVSKIANDVHGTLRHEHGDKLHKMSDKKVQEHIDHKLNEHEIKAGKTLDPAVKESAKHHVHAKIHAAKLVNGAVKGKRGQEEPEPDNAYTPAKKGKEEEKKSSKKPADKKEPAKGKPTPKKDEKGKPAKKEEKKPETKKPEKKESFQKKDEKPKK